MATHTIAASPPRGLAQAIQEFATTLRGELFVPDDPGYDDARSVYNGMIDKRPAAIARCADVADVVATVSLAR